MELRHIRYFVAVAEECHFGRAAERLHIAQPPLSQQIKQLESDLGVVLLTRSTRKVELTPAGQRYLERARAILAAVDAAGEEASRVAAGELGRLAIGFTGSATYDLLPSLARVLRSDFPGIELDLRGEMLTPDQVDALVDHSLDLGFLRPPVRHADIEVRVLRREPLIAVVPEAHPLASVSSVKLVDLRDETFITYPSHHRSVVYEAVLDACERVGFIPTEVHEVGETSTPCHSLRPVSASRSCQPRFSTCRSPGRGTCLSRAPRKRSNSPSRPDSTIRRRTWPGCVRGPRR